MANNGNLRVLGLGNALVDIMTVMQDNTMLESFGLTLGCMTLVDDEKSKQIQTETKHLERRITPGGSVANAMRSMALLNAPAGFWGSICDDELGHYYKDTLDGAGMTTHFKKVEAQTGRAVALVSPGGERTFATYLGAAIEFSAEDLCEEVMKKYDVLFIEGYLVQNTELIKAAAAMAKKNGLKTAIDLASFNVVEDNFELLNGLVKDYIDIVFANEEEAKAFSHKEPREALDYIGAMCDIAIVKIGKDGALIQSNGETIQVPAFSSNPVDTTGAGDYFAGGFLTGISKGYDLEKSARLGAICSGHIIQVVGVQLDKKTWEEIRTLEAGL